MAKVLVAGAGIGGVMAAYRLAQNGFDVTVYEAKSYDKVTYDWHDDVAKDVFARVGLPQPDESMRREKRNWTFVVPGSPKHLFVPLEVATDYTIMRRPLLHWLIGLAREAGAKFEFETTVGLWVKEDKVLGLAVGDHNVKADLVIDCTGVDSRLREMVPEVYKIQQKPDQYEVFSAFRGFFERNEGVEVPDHETNRAYLLHQGGKGISWCIADPADKEVDILIGRADGLDDNTLNVLLESLREDNPVLSDKLVSGGKVCRIPIRYPLTRMVADGYVAIGDAAFMTIPMLGSGMAASLDAAQILSEVLVQHQSVSKEALWHYQVRFFKQVGADFCSVDVLKRWLLNCNPDDIRWVVDSGVLAESDFGAVATGEPFKLTVKQTVQKACKGISRLHVLLAIAGVMKKGEKAKKVALAIPEVYDEEAISRWEAKLRKFLK